MENQLESNPKKIGFFGGSFDPFHQGHFKMASEAIELENFDQLLICPAHHAPLRDEKPLFSAKDRLAMVQAISECHPKFFPYSYEIERERTCFTFETISSVLDKFPNSKVHVLLGTDQFEQIDQWKKITKLSKLVHFLVLARGNCSPPSPRVSGLSFSLMKNSLIDLSSTEIRRHFLAGRCIKQFLPSPVHSYLVSHSKIQDFNHE